MDDMNALAAPDAERDLLSALMLPSGRERVFDVAYKLSPDDFAQINNAVIFEAMVSMSHQGVIIDIVTLVEALRTSGKLDKIGGITEITSIGNRVPTAANIGRYVDIILSRSRRRKMVQICREGLEAAGDITRDVDFGELQARISELGLEKSPDLQSLHDDLPNWYNWLSKPSMSVSTGFPDIDQILGGGWQPTDFGIIAARPAVGKSAFALQSAIAAARSGVPTLFISLEMGKNLLISRAMAAAAHVPGIKIIRKDVNQHDIDKLHAQDDTLPDQLYITDRVSSDYVSVINCIRMAVARFAVRVVYIDYLLKLPTSPTLFI